MSNKKQIVVEFDLDNEKQSDLYELLKVESEIYGSSEGETLINHAQAYLELLQVQGDTMLDTLRSLRKKVK